MFARWKWYVGQPVEESSGLKAGMFNSVAKVFIHPFGNVATLMLLEDCSDR